MPVDEAQKVVNLMLLGMVSQMPAEQKRKVEDAAEKLRAVIKEYGDEGEVAMGIVGSEMAAKL